MDYNVYMTRVIFYTIYVKMRCIIVAIIYGSAQSTTIITADTYFYWHIKPWGLSYGSTTGSKCNSDGDFNARLQVILQQLNEKNYNYIIAMKLCQDDYYVNYDYAYTYLCNIYYRLRSRKRKLITTCVCV